MKVGMVAALDTASVLLVRVALCALAELLSGDRHLVGEGLFLAAADAGPIEGVNDASEGLDLYKIEQSQLEVLGSRGPSS